jgi:hypothetical protein
MIVTKVTVEPLNIEQLLVCEVHQHEVFTESYRVRVLYSEVPLQPLPTARKATLKEVSLKPALVTTCIQRPPIQRKLGPVHVPLRSGYSTKETTSVIKPVIAAKKMLG